MVPSGEMSKLSARAAEKEKAMMLAKNIALAKAQEINERLRQEGRLTESVPGLGVNYTDKAVVPPQVSQVPQEELTTTTTSASHRDVNVTVPL